jgi:hypothetical protein
LRYSSNDGALEMDLRGSGSSFGSGSRVSAMPPVPMCFFGSPSFCSARCRHATVKEKQERSASSAHAVKHAAPVLQVA